MQETLSFEELQHEYGEADQDTGPGCLSVLLWPPFSVLLFGSLLFWGLSSFVLGGAAPAQAASSGQLASFFAPEVLRWEKQIVAWAREHELDPNLVATVMQIESCGDPLARSGAGAMGLFQVMPYHFAAGEDTYEPRINALRGLDYLRGSLESAQGSIDLAFAGYNGGINGAQRPRSLWAQETIDYVYWGENIYADASAGRESSPTLDEWLVAGGASLCAQAAARLAAVP